ncbi:hypothetical protein ACIQV3_18135 [Streptomyces sp. NPDC099050]|uniref:hypothetical protein n=1 Tax=Streptomyces sp. NPDC099050 TaxID=3366100 RepID=UPI0037F364AB
MAMVGLFWITEDAVYVGSPPNAAGHCVRLTSEGVRAHGPDGLRSWPWPSLRSAVVRAVPVRNTAKRAGRFLAAVLEAVMTMETPYAHEGPPQMLLSLATEDGTEELWVPAATSGYTSREIALSQRLLARYREGACAPRTLTAWSRKHLGAAPAPPEREALLREWVNASGAGPGVRGAVS